MKVDEVIAEFLMGDAGRSQNVRAYHKTAPDGERYGVLSTYDEPIAAWRGPGFPLYIDDMTKYTVTSTRHRNTLIAMAKLAGLDWTRIGRSNLRAMLGLDPNEQFSAAKKLAYRGGAAWASPAAAAPAPVGSRKVFKVKDPITYAIPPLTEGQVQIEAVCTGRPSQAASRLVREAEDNLAGADVLVAIPRKGDAECDVTLIDDGGHRVVVDGGFSVGEKGIEAGKESLLEAMGQLGFQVTAHTETAVRQSPGKVVVFLASGMVEEYQ